MTSLRDTLAKLKEQKQNQLGTKLVSSAGSASWVKKGDLEKERQQKYFEEQKQREEEKRQKQELRLQEIQSTYSVSNKVTQLKDFDSKPKEALEKLQINKAISSEAQNLNINKDKNQSEEEINTFQSPIPREEVIIRLRKLKQEATLFGETDKMRYERLLIAEQVNSEEKVPQESINTFIPKEEEIELLKQVKLLEIQMEENLQKQNAEKQQKEQQALQQIREQQLQKFHNSSTHPLQTVDHLVGIYKSAEELRIGDRDINELVEIKEKSGQSFRNYKKFEIACKRHPIEEKCLIIYLWCKKMLKAWEAEISQRDENYLRSAEGKIELGTQKQCYKHCKPFFKQLKKRQVNDEIMDGVYLIVQYTMMKEYVRAHDKYLELAIGNAPWPMGVTMVGIHERAGRSKIFSSQVAHILNDENQRKTLQAVKRLLTVCQRVYPTDPSKCVSN